MTKKINSGSELRLGKINKITRSEIQRKTDIIWDVAGNLEAQLKRISSRKEKVGSYDYTKQVIQEGSMDRLLAVSYDPNKYQDKQMQNAYREGFFEHGTRELFGKLDILSEDELIAIGYNDYFCGIKMSELLDDIRKNDSYASGYLSAVVSDSNKKSK